jgi:uncharacterized membrane protein
MGNGIETRTLIKRFFLGIWFLLTRSKISLLCKLSIVTAIIFHWFTSTKSLSRGRQPGTDYMKLGEAEPKCQVELLNNYIDNDSMRTNKCCSVSLALKNWRFGHQYNSIRHCCYIIGLPSIALVFFLDYITVITSMRISIRDGVYHTSPSCHVRIVLAKAMEQLVVKNRTHTWR